NGNGITFQGGTGNEVGLPVGIQPTNVAMQFNGAINIVTPGTYTFNTGSDDGSLLFIDGTQVVSNDNTHGNTTVSGTINLGAGLHSFQVSFIQAGGGGALTSQYSGPDTGGTLVLIPAAATPTSPGLLSGLPSTVNALNPAFALTFAGPVN